MRDLEEKVGIIKQVAETFPEPTKEVCKALTTIVKSINLALVPLSSLVWGYEKIAAWLEPKLAEKLENVPQENIVTPSINIAGPTIEAIRFTGESDELREMYANLLASSMNKETANRVHPRFVEVIKNMTADEAKLLDFMDKRTILNKITVLYLTKVDQSRQWYFIVNEYDQLIDITSVDLNVPNNLLIYLDNFCHLGILQDNINPIEKYGMERNIEHLKSDFPYVEDCVLDYLKGDGKVLVSRVRYLSTCFGNSFIRQILNNR